MSTITSIFSPHQNSKSIPKLSTAQIQRSSNKTVSIEILIYKSDLTSSKTHETETISYVSKINVSYLTAVDTDTTRITTTIIRYHISKFVSASTKEFNSVNNKGETQIIPKEHFSEGSLLFFSDLRAFFSSTPSITKRAPLSSEFVSPTI